MGIVIRRVSIEKIYTDIETEHEAKEVVSTWLVEGYDPFTSSHIERAEAIEIWGPWDDVEVWRTDSVNFETE